VNDKVRCQSQTIIAGALQSGGKPKLDAALQAAIVTARQRIAELDSFEYNPDKDYLHDCQKAAVAARRERLTRGIGNMQYILATPIEQLEQSDLDLAADTMYEANSPNSKYVMGVGTNSCINSAPPMTPGGDWQGGGTDADVTETMETSYGVASETTGSKLVSGSDAQGVSEQIWGDISEGEQTRVSVSASGRPDEFDIKAANHVVLFGKRDDGCRYVYNSAPPPGYPVYFFEDPEHPERFDEYVAKLMAGTSEKSGAHTRSYTNQN
jgi:hypothetical protein